MSRSKGFSNNMPHILAHMRLNMENQRSLDGEVTPKQQSTGASRRFVPHPRMGVQSKHLPFGIL